MDNKIRIDYLDKERFRKKQQRKMQVRRRLVGGLAIGLSFGILAGSLLNGGLHSEDKNVETGMETEVTSTDIGMEDEKAIDVDLEDINHLDIIVNDHDCSDNFFNGVCEQLETDGITFTKTAGNDNIDVNGAVVVTLDQQYLSGPGMVIFSPNNNERKGDSDALALAMETGFDANGISVDGIFSGKIGYRETDFGEVQSRVPTSSEEAISEDNDTSFTTLAFGTTSISPEVVAKSIENGLARYVNYEDNKAFNDDLIYRVEGGDIMPDVEKVFGCSQERIEAYNDLIDKNGYVYMNDTLRNPHIGSYDAFDNEAEVNLKIETTKSY